MRDGPPGRQSVDAASTAGAGHVSRPARPAVVIVGDVVASRRFVDEAALLQGLRSALQAVNDVVPSVSPLTLRVRDEFQAAYRDLGDAATAALRLRLATDDLVLPTLDGVDEPVELRLGIGIGASVTDADHATGSAWRHAAAARRDAQVFPAKHAWPPSLRSVCRADDPTLQATVSGYLLLQDQLLARLDARDRRALVGLLDGERQVDIAAALGVTQPAIARRVKDRGALAIARALDGLRGAGSRPG